MATEQIRIDEVPAIGAIQGRLKHISGEIKVEAAGHDFDAGGYVIRLRPGDSEAVVIEGIARRSQRQPEWSVDDLYADLE